MTIIRSPALELKSVQRSYGEGDHRLVILDGADFELARGEMVALIATHNHELAARMDRRVTLAKGKIVDF